MLHRLTSKPDPTLFEAYIDFKRWDEAKLLEHDRTWFISTDGDDPDEKDYPKARPLSDFPKPHEIAGRLLIERYEKKNLSVEPAAPRTHRPPDPFAGRKISLSLIDPGGKLNISPSGKLISFEQWGVVFNSGKEEFVPWVNIKGGHFVDK